ncbi:MAG: nucleotide sugar dehydrogenase [Bacteroidetes bacterium]|nr:nucleotide sugar dehydrogenase [Bacteroidota bacterium]MCA6442055.1 nucleotide sugar dehydrogenase [Bacteroidota bacterium]
MKIGIFGLGYVGVVNAACFTKLGHYVIGCDVKETKVDMLRKGKSPIYEPKVDELLMEALQSGQLSATTSVSEVINNAEVLLICVGTPSNSNGEVNLDFIYNTSFEIAKEIKSLGKEITILYRSTIPPNTLKTYIEPIFKTILKDEISLVALAFYPEFLREGKAVDDFFNAPRIVLGSDSDQLDKAKNLLAYNPEIPFYHTNPQTSEFVKYVDNTFHALKVAFVNEVYEVAKSFDVDVSTANEIFLNDRSLNISTAYLKPGLPFGGSCLPKDLRAIVAMAKSQNLKLPLLESISESNAHAMNRLEQLILKQNKSKIFFVGFTFKNYTDDYRESPILTIIERLIKSNYDVKFTDVDANLVNLRIDKPSLIKYYQESITEGIKCSDLIVVSKRYLVDVVKLNHDKKLIINCSRRTIEDNSIIHLF